METTQAPDRLATENDRRKIAESLARALADTYTLYLKTQNFHWNVTGPKFFGLHKALEEQYQELQGAADDIAERIRALGYPANATLADFQRLTKIKEETLHDEAGVAKSLLAGHEATVATLRDAFNVADAAGDQATLDLLASRERAHQKTMWMLRSLQP